ncbi:MAG: CpsD/CapB family tyrosine-protein kinase [Paenibacillaceae bacterium]|nr:CpsD/CapB family tyrosine-protein kinase [Paenibacillaceae bacterium]
MSRLSKSLIAELDPASTVAESFRVLRTAIRHKKGKAAAGGLVLMVASSKPQEGKTAMLSNLAVTYAQDGKKVVAIDGNLRQPSLHEAFGIRGDKGLVQAIKSSVSLKDAVSPSGYPHLDVLPAGGQPSNPSELLGSAAMAGLLDELKRTYDVVLLDSPATLDYTDAGLLAEISDGVMLVVKRGRTKREWAQKAKERLEQAGAGMLGIVLNK